MKLRRPPQNPQTIAATADQGPVVSIVVPFYNEEASIVPLHAAIVSAVEPLGHRFEMVFVDDGSADATFNRAIGLAARDTRVRVVRFRRNCGQTAAMAAGIEYARGKIIVTMDGDLQNDPADIANFLTELDRGHDIVIGWRRHRQDKLISRKLPSRVANWLIGKVTGVPVRDNGCSLKAFRAELIKGIPLYSEMHRFIPAITSVAGPRLKEIPVRHHARQFGTSKYGLSRIYKVLLDLLVIKTIATFSSRPLLWFSILSLPLLAWAIGCFAFVVLSAAVSGHTLSLPIAGSGIISLSGAAVLLGSGALAEFVYRTGDLRDTDFARLTWRVGAEDSSR